MSATLKTRVVQELYALSNGKKFFYSNIGIWAHFDAVLGAVAGQGVHCVMREAGVFGWKPTEDDRLLCGFLACWIGTDYDDALQPLEEIS